MKTRTGFVSNSSTTSFTCQVSGCTEAYHDSCSLEDAGGAECVMGHVFYSQYTLPAIPDEVPPAQAEAEAEDDEDDYDEDYGRLPMKQCPICMAQRMDLNLVQPFLLKKLGWTEDQIWTEMQKLGGYEDMLMYIRGGK